MRPRTAVVLLSVAAFLLGCAEAPTRPPETSRGPGTSGVRIAVRFTSDVPDRYEVLSGPMETYRRLGVNDRLRGLLVAYAREKSDETSARTAGLAHLDRVTTTYRQLGARDPAPAAAGRVVPASFDDTLEDSRPEEIQKTATVALTVEVRSGGTTLLRESLTAEETQVTQRLDIDPWAYDFTAVVDAALRKTVVALDVLVDRVLGRAK